MFPHCLEWHGHREQYEMNFQVFLSGFLVSRRMSKHDYKQITLCLDLQFKFEINLRE